jgi:hypothetical protein
MKNVLPEVLVGFVAMLSGLALGTGCAYLRESAAQPCKAEGATADTCKALPAIRAKYARERQAWVECGGGK